MKLEDQVVSLELAKKLKELRIIKPSIFGWIYHQHSDAQAWACKHKEPNASWYVIRGTNDHKSILWEGDKEISAFTISELMDLLPACVDKTVDEPFNFHWLHLKKRQVKNIQWIANYICDSTSDERGWDFFPLFDPNIYDEKLADCLAKLIIKLIESGLIKVSE